MKKIVKIIIKIIFLILICVSVYIIYSKTKNKTYNLTSIGDKLSLGIDSYNIKNYSYIDYYEDYLKTTKENVIINNKYSSETQTIKNILNSMKESELKRIITDSDQIILTLGYNDILTELSMLENKNNYDYVIKEIKTDYLNLIKEIKKYYRGEIIVIGYFKSNTNDYYINKGIKDLNKILNNKEVVYIDTYNLLSNRKEYFSNPNSYYPNYKGYQRIYNEIIRKDLQKSK